MKMGSNFFIFLNIIWFLLEILTKYYREFLIKKQGGGGAAAEPKNSNKGFFSKLKGAADQLGKKKDAAVAKAGQVAATLSGEEAKQKQQNKMEKLGSIAIKVGELLERKIFHELSEGLVKTLESENKKKQVFEATPLFKTSLDMYLTQK